MARKPRIEIAGYYHLINRGVEQRVIFKEKEDFVYFEEILCFYAKSHEITVHNYCLMSNHYHLLIEIEHENLSKFMKQLNGSYAIYFNKKYTRSGHLWQGRFRSWYVTDEAYLYTLMLYIEQNSLKATMVKAVGDYPYSSAYYFLSTQTLPECLRDSWIAQNYKNDHDEIQAFLETSVDTAQLQELKKASSLLEASNLDNKPDIEKLKKIFAQSKEIKERNILILNTYRKGYSQHMIAKVLGLAQSTVSAIVKRMGK